MRLSSSLLLHGPGLAEASMAMIFCAWGAALEMESLGSSAFCSLDAFQAYSQLSEVCFYVFQASF